nr:hypothetical protein CFP56_07842 [Quercus suber]
MTVRAQAPTYEKSKGRTDKEVTDSCSGKLMKGNAVFLFMYGFVPRSLFVSWLSYVPTADIDARFCFEEVNKSWHGIVTLLTLRFAGRVIPTK